MELPYGERDDLRFGRSCVYTASNGWLPAFGRNPWACQECRKGVCQPLKRRGKCAPFRRKEADRTPRVYSEWSSFTYQKSHTLVWHHDGHSEYAQKSIPDCSATLSLPCFNLKRCPRFGPLKVFPYGEEMEALLDYAIEQTTGDLLKVNNQQESCLLVVGKGSFEKSSQLFSDRYWMGGQNHYIFYSSDLFGSHPDRPFNSKVNFRMAATSQWSVDDAYLREGYDTPLGLYPLWKRPAKYEKLNIHRERRLLLSLKENINEWEQRNWQHRWIAAEYWKEEPDVHVDAQCSGHGHKQTSPESYEELLLNSTFVFCPGGEGSGSDRFAESLSAGAIPVVTSDFLPPFHPEIDWSGCIVQVSEARVVDIPNFVRDISDDLIRVRQKNCYQLYQKVFGEDAEKNQFSVAMQIWAARVRNAHRKKFEIDDGILEKVV